MTALGVTGHQTIPPDARDFVLTAPSRTSLRDVDSPLDALTCWRQERISWSQQSSRAGARLHVIVPSRNYEQTFAAGEDLACFRSLLEAAHAVTRLDHAEPSEEAFLAAGKSVVHNCAVMIAVWDGKPARGPGGTADVGGYARDTGKGVSIVWPTASTAEPTAGRRSDGRHAR